MKKTVMMIAVIAIGSVIAAVPAKAQETIVVEETTIFGEIDCQDRYYSTWRDNWFIQMGAGINVPFVENYLTTGDPNYQITATYNLGFGKWMSPYLGWRMTMYYGSMHWDNGAYSKAKMANANFDIMWDMFNSTAGANPKRVFSIIPFVGVGGTFTWDLDAPYSNIYKSGEELKQNAWLLPVSAGLQLRFRLCSYADFFLEGRASLYGDNFNLCAYGNPIDVDITAIGGFSFNIGGSNFKTYNPCNDLTYIRSLNNRINTLRNDLAATATALAAAEAQLPCPEVEEEEVIIEQIVETSPLMSTVRFAINSAHISPEEMINVYNVAEYLKANPDVNVEIVGYADKATGTADYNKTLSHQRAQSVHDALTKTYGIAANRLSLRAEGSATQPYDVNDWNRIVIFVAE